MAALTYVAADIDFNCKVMMIGHFATLVFLVLSSLGFEGEYCNFAMRGI